MAVAINRSNIAKQLLPGLNAIFGTEYNSIDNEHVPLFDVETSERAYEEEVLQSMFATAPQKMEGAAVEYDSASELWTARYTHITVALAFAITEEAFEDNLYDTFSKIRAKALGRSMANTKQVIGANVFNNGFSTSFNLGDGVPLFSASHPTQTAGLQSNTVSADLSEAALENALINISLFRDDRGILIGSQAQSLHIPPQLIFVAERILKTPGRVGVADNDINALRNMNMVPKGCFVNHRFTDSNAWFLRTDVPNGSKHFVRAKLYTKMEPDFDTGNQRFKARERYSFGVSQWRQWYGSNGST
jgi:hypothetical protein